MRLLSDLQSAAGAYGVFRIERLFLRARSARPRLRLDSTSESYVLRTKCRRVSFSLKTTSFHLSHRPEYTYTYARARFVTAPRDTHPVYANCAKYLIILRARSRSLSLYSRDAFKGCPKTYSTSSPCITPIHLPHTLVLVLCNNGARLRHR